MDPETSKVIEEDERFEVRILAQGLMGAGDLASCRKIRDQERARGGGRGLAQIAVEQGLLDPSQLASLALLPGGRPSQATANKPAKPTPSPGFKEAPHGLKPHVPLPARRGQGSTPVMTPGGTEVSLPAAPVSPSRGPPASAPPGPASEAVDRRADAEIDAAMLGSDVAGFRILDVLGRGAMGTVFRARQTSLDRDVAFKVLASRYTNDEEFIERFHREAKAAGRFNHPNVVSGIDCGTAVVSGLEIHYFVMELVAGQSLSEVMAARGPLPELEALRITRAVLDGLGMAHDAGLVHRDVKPDNILIDSEHKPKLADLGLAKDLRRGNSLTVEGLVMGTPNYMAPEQAIGDASLDGRADLYALGIALFEMLTGQLPFKDDSPMMVLTMHVNEDVPSPRSLRADLSPATCAISTGLCQRNRRHRYHHAKAAIADIDHVLAMNRLGQSAPVASLPSRSQGPVPSRPSPSALPAAGRSPATRHSTTPRPTTRTRSSSGDLSVATPGRTPRGRSTSGRRLASMRTSSQRLAMAPPGSTAGIPQRLGPIMVAAGGAVALVGALAWLSSSPPSPADAASPGSANAKRRTQLEMSIKVKLSARQLREAAAEVFDRTTERLNDSARNVLPQLQRQVLDSLEASIEAQLANGRYRQAMDLLREISDGGPEAAISTSALMTRVQDHAAQSEELAIAELMESVPYQCRQLQLDAANAALDAAPLVSNTGQAWLRLLHDMVREVELVAQEFELSADDRLPSLGDILAMERLGDLLEPGLGLGPLAGEALISAKRSWQGPRPATRSSGVEGERRLQKSAFLALSLDRHQELAVLLVVAERQGRPLNPLLHQICSDHAKTARQRADLAETASSLLASDGDLAQIEEGLKALSGAPDPLGEPEDRRWQALARLAQARRWLDQGNLADLILESDSLPRLREALWPIEWLELMAASTTASMAEAARKAEVGDLEWAASDAEQALAQTLADGVSPSSHGGPLGRDLERSIADARRHARILTSLRDLGRKLEETQPDQAAVTQLALSVSPIRQACNEILDGPGSGQGPSIYARQVRDLLTASTCFVESIERLGHDGPGAADRSLDALSALDPGGQFSAAFQHEIAALHKLVQGAHEVIARVAADAARRPEPTPPEPDGGGAPPPAEPTKPEIATTERIVVADTDDLRQGFKIPKTWNWEGGLINNAQNPNTFLRFPMTLLPNGGRVRQVSLLIDLEQQHKQSNMPVLAISACGFTCFISQDKLGLHAGDPNRDWLSQLVNKLYTEANLELEPANPNNTVRPWQRGIYVLDMKIADLGSNQPNGLEVTVTLSRQGARRPNAKLNIVGRAPMSKRKRGQLQLYLFQQYHVTELTVVREDPDSEKDQR